MRRAAPFALVALLALAGAARADVPRTDAPRTDAPRTDALGQLADPAQEARAHALFRQVRCVVCQNESIDDSEAELAGDLRRIVREQVSAGRTDASIRDFLVARYGAFVLLKPRLDAGNAVLWLGPFALLAGGGVAALLRRAPRRPEAPLTADERMRLEALRTAAPPVTLPP